MKKSSPKSVKFTLAKADFQSLISRTAHAAATEDNRPILTMLHWKSNGRTLTVTGADGFVLDQARIAVKLASFEWLLPVEALAALKFGRAATIEIEWVGDAVSFNGQNIALADGKYPDLVHLIPTSFQQSFDVDTDCLIRLLKGMMAIFNPVTFSEPAERQYTRKPAKGMRTDGDYSEVRYHLAGKMCTEMVAQPALPFKQPVFIHAGRRIQPRRPQRVEVYPFGRFSWSVDTLTVFAETEAVNVTRLMPIVPGGVYGGISLNIAMLISALEVAPSRVTINFNGKAAPLAITAPGWLHLQMPVMPRR